MRAEHRPTYAVIDVETTGVRANDGLVEFACVTVDDNGGVLDAFDTLIDPRRDPGPAWLHGITSEMCAGAPSFPDIAGTIHDLLVGRVLIAHRLRFDWRMLRRSFDRVGTPFLREAQGICTAALAREAGVNGGLQRVARAVGVRERQAHTALDDAMTTRDVWLRLRARGVRGGEPLPPACGAHRLARSCLGRSRRAASSDSRPADRREGCHLDG